MAIVESAVAGLTVGVAQAVGLRIRLRGRGRRRRLWRHDGRLRDGLASRESGRIPPTVLATVESLGKDKKRCMRGRRGQP